VGNYVKVDCGWNKICSIELQRMDELLDKINKFRAKGEVTKN